jgi:uncharacterized protein YyaL (SSP411 family)
MKKLMFLCIAGLVVLTFGCGKSNVNPNKSNNDTTGSQGNTSPGVSVYLTNAKATHTLIQSSYLTAYGGYRVNLTTTTNSAYEWYNASQLYADAAMVANGDATYLPAVNNTYNWLQGLIDKSDPNGGYFSFANLDGSGGSGAKYVDDNSLTGVAYLAAYDVTTGTTQANYLAAAEGCANWLMNSGQWDSSLGGGFWWNTDKMVKPTQSNGLALQLFLRLYQLTGQSTYHDWAVKINTWLNTYMLDNTTGLYIWQIENSGTLDSYKFTYDNAIMLEADLWWAKVMNDNTYVTKAEALANAMLTTLYNKNYNVFIFNTNDSRINPCYCVWASQAFISLYQTDGNATWLTYAKANIDKINVVMENTADNGYYQYAGLDGSGRYPNMEGVDQAWMERVQVLLSKYK